MKNITVQPNITIHHAMKPLMQFSWVILKNYGIIMKLITIINLTYKEEESVFEIY